MVHWGVRGWGVHGVATEHGGRSGSVSVLRSLLGFLFCIFLVDNFFQGGYGGGWMEAEKDREKQKRNEESKKG